MKEMTISKATLSDRYQLVIGNKVMFLTPAELSYLKGLLGVKK